MKEAKNLGTVIHTLPSLKNNLKVIIAFIIGIIIASSITIYAYSNYASQVGYTTDKNTNIQNVDQALNDLYNKRNKILLWSNSNQYSDCEAFDIPLSSSIENYSHILIQYKIKTDSIDVYDDLFSTSIDRPNAGEDKGLFAIGARDATSINVYRGIRAYDSVTLRCGRAINTDGVVESNYLIPIAVYGLNL